MDKLIIKNISKTYSNGVKALDNISLEISNGMFGLLGPNGAGKSSLMRTLATLQEADGGSVTLGQINVLKQKDEVRNMLGYLPQDFGVYPKVSAEMLLDHLAVLKGITNRKERKDVVDSLLQKTNLYESRRKNLGGYSGGMKQRFGIAQALLANPKLIIVDEPTAGLDPAERNRFHNLLCELGEKTIVILSTHIVDDVKELCNQMAIINKGKVLLKASPKDAIDQIKGKIYSRAIRKDEISAYQSDYLVIAERLYLGQPIIHIYSDVHPGKDFNQVDPDLEDVYFTQIFGSQNRQ